ncbi:hypothetical protein [Enterococcus sp. DIV0421]|uniref:hypothetical protein n=1 Tax=Enterococcus sp. DIV0421 TaxID=2774688 RepID=UPI003F683936
MRELDKQEQNAIFGFNLRYILNAKKPQLQKVINKNKAENKIRSAFERNTYQVEKRNNRLGKALNALKHFKNRR